MSDGKGYRIYFVSGSTSTAPITADTVGYIASTSTAVNVINASGSINWDVTTDFDSLNLKWHAYLCSNSTWSEMSDIYSFTIQGKNKFIFFYRNGDGSTGGPLTYRIISGAGNGADIELIQKDATFSIFPAYMYSWSDPVSKKIWVSWTWHTEACAPKPYGDDSALYTYSASLQSWKGDWDYWWYPNGAIAGSGTQAIDVRLNGTELTYFTCSANRAGPYTSGTTLYYNTAGHSTGYEKMTSMANGELVCFTNISDPIIGTSVLLELWYLSSNINPYNSHWIKTLTLSSGLRYPEENEGTNCNAPYCGTVIPTMSGLALIYYSGTKVVARLSNDFARTFTEPELITDEAGTGMFNICFLPIIPKYEYEDEYARAFYLRTSGYNLDNAGEIRFVSFNTNNNTVSDISLIGFKISTCLWISVLTNTGVFVSGLSLFGAPKTKTGDTATGDPRYIHWYNENTAATGSKLAAPVGTSTVDYDTHNSACARIDENGNIFLIGAQYFSALSPDLVSSNTIDGVYSVKNDNINTDGGRVSSAFEIFN